MNMEDYLIQLAQEYLTPFDGEVYWNKKKHRFEIYGTIFSANTSHIALTDVDEVTSTEDVIEFTDGFCFYDEKYPVSSHEFLAGFPFSRKRGLEKGILKGAMVYFAEILASGEKELAAFLTQDDEDLFELSYSKEALKKYLIKYQEEKELISYPKF